MNKSKKTKVIKVAELFAGVGGFRIGLDRANKPTNAKTFKTVWSNQWEPATKVQHASLIYKERFGEQAHSNEDIAKVDVKDIPDHDLLVGGFPCQDYSVARTLGHAAGLEGKKGVLWWQIFRILKTKGSKRPPYLFLENVDRLLKSPAKQRGRDFAIMLASLSDLGYVVEWRVINAADYGMPQRRRRVFIIGYYATTPLARKVISLFRTKNVYNWIQNSGLLSSAFPVSEIIEKNNFKIVGDSADLSEKFNKGPNKLSPFMNSGVMYKRMVYTSKVKPKYSGPRTLLRDILQKDTQVPKEFFINNSDLKKWKYLKGGKKEIRKTKSGFTYTYNEGPIAFPDKLNEPSRTIITGEGGATPSRFKHIIKTSTGQYRRLTPVELERLCMFPDDHTAGQPDVRRAFFMGNALVVGVIERIGRELLRRM